MCRHGRRKEAELNSSQSYLIGESFYGFYGSRDDATDFSVSWAGVGPPPSMVHLGHNSTQVGTLKQVKALPFYQLPLLDGYKRPVTATSVFFPNTPHNEKTLSKMKPCHYGEVNVT